MQIEIRRRGKATFTFISHFTERRGQHFTQNFTQNCTRKLTQEFQDGRHDGRGARRHGVLRREERDEHRQLDLQTPLSLVSERRKTFVGHITVSQKVSDEVGHLSGSAYFKANILLLIDLRASGLCNLIDIPITVL